MRFRIIGNGAFGSALSVIFKKNMILEDSLGDEFLPFEENDIIVPAVPSDVLILVIKKLQLDYRKKHTLMLVSKGLASDCLLDDLIKQEISDNFNFLYFVGPNLAKEIIQNQELNSLEFRKTFLSATIAGPELITQDIAKFLDNVITDQTKDLILPQIAGVVKNITAFVIGYLNPNQNGRASLIMQGMKEAVLFANFLGSKEAYNISAAYFGDFVLTCTSEGSRNFTAGRKFKDGSINEMGENGLPMTYESLKSVDNVWALKKDLQLPIIEFFYNLVKHNVCDIEKLVNSI